VSLWSGHWCSEARLLLLCAWSTSLHKDDAAGRLAGPPGAAEQVGSRSFGPLLSAERLGRKGRSVGRSVGSDPNPESGSSSALGKRSSSSGGGGFRGWMRSVQEVMRGTARRAKHRRDAQAYRLVLAVQYSTDRTDKNSLATEDAIDDTALSGAPLCECPQRLTAPVMRSVLQCITTLNLYKTNVFSAETLRVYENTENARPRNDKTNLTI